MKATNTGKKIIFGLWITAVFIAFFLDKAIFNFFSGIQIGFLTSIFSFTESKTFMVMLIIAAGVFLFFKKRDTMYRFWLAVGLTFIATFFIKLLIERERPLGTELMMFGLPDYSFPSAHAALSFCLFAFYHKEFNNQAHLWFVIVAFISFSRIYISAHYLSDVIAGALLGYFVGLTFAEKK